MNNAPDVIIVGGGAIGLCAAYYLLKDGASVVVIDKGEMGHGSSLHNAGYICPSHFVPLAAPGVFAQALKWMLSPSSPFYVKPRLDRELIAWAWQFRKSSTERAMRRAMPLLRDLLVDGSRLMEELSREPGMEFQYAKQGLCMLFATERGRSAVEHEARLADELGMEARLLDRRQLQAMDPGIEFGAMGGAFYPGDAHLLPVKLVQDLSSALVRSGATLIENCPVEGFVLEGGRIASVKTPKGWYESREVVLAGGAWSSGILRDIGVRMLMQPGKGYSITIPRPPRKPVHPYIFTERRVVVTPFQDSLRFAGTMEMSGLDTSIHQLRIRAMLDAIPVYMKNIVLPPFSDFALWAGLRPVSPDGLPYIGRFRQVSNLTAATGHAMLGISLATVTGKLVAEILGGRPSSHDLALLDPQRFG